MNNFSEKLKTIARPTSSLFKDRGSKFLGFCFQANDIEEVKARLNEVKREHPKATHHCFAYRLGIEGINFRANDDGEPSGSAGRPILGQIDSAGLTNILIIVVRYYGGTMLGVPGLINAYKTAAADAIKVAETVEKWICKATEITTDYNTLSEVLYWLKHYEATIIHQDLLLFCTIKTNIPLKNWEACTSQLGKIKNLSIR